MRRYWFARGMRFLLFGVIAIAAFGGVVMMLWNWLAPDLFGGHPIGFWQALGLLVLGRILVGGWRGGLGFRGPWRARMLERWEHMTEEERQRFREGMRHGCGRREASAEPKI